MYIIHNTIASTVASTVAANCKTVVADEPS
jgi:hypothetical protein